LLECVCGNWEAKLHYIIANYKVAKPFLRHSKVRELLNGSVLFSLASSLSFSCYLWLTMHAHTHAHTRAHTHTHSRKYVSVEQLKFRYG